MAQIDRLNIFQRGNYFPDNEYHRGHIENFLVRFAQESPEKYEEYLELYNNKAEELGAKPFPRITIVKTVEEVETPEEKTEEETEEAEETETVEEVEESEVSNEEESTEEEAEETTEVELLTEDQFKELTADEQRAKLAELEVEGDTGNEEKRVALYLDYLSQ